MKFSKKIFITGIGTNVGKSYVTGWMAREMAQIGVNVITQKFIQTGNKGMSEDIEVHRKIMGIPLQLCDIDGATAPIILTYPASPHLAAAIDNVTLDLSDVDKATEKLLNDYGYETVLIEGAGGICVPLYGNYLTIDYIAEHHIETVVVTNGQLGSINHTLLTLNMLIHRSVPVPAVVYNPYFDEDKTICEDTRKWLKNWINDNMPETKFIEMPLRL